MGATSVARRERDARLTLKELRPFASRPQMLDLRLWTGMWLPNGHPLPRLAGGEVKTATVFCYPGGNGPLSQWARKGGLPEAESWKEVAQYGCHNGATAPNTAKAVTTETKEAKEEWHLDTPRQSLEREKPGVTFLKVKAGQAFKFQVYAKEAATKALESKLFNNNNTASTAFTWEGTTGPEWKESAAVAAGVKETLEKNEECQVVLKALLAKKCEVFCFVVPVEVEYEEAGGESFSGALAQKVGLLQSVSGFKATGATVAQTAGLKQATAGAKTTGGTVAQQLGVRQALVGLKAAAGSVAQALGLRQANSGIKAGVGAVIQRAGVRQATAGSKTTSGATAQTVGLAQATSGFKRAAGAIAQQLGLRQSISNVLGGAVLQVLGLVQHVTGYKSAEGAARQQVGVAQTTAGRKTVGGAIRSLIGLVQRIVGAVAGEEPAEQFGEPYEGLPRSPDAGSSPEVEPGRVETRELP